MSIISIMTIIPYSIFWLINERLKAKNWHLDVSTLLTFRPLNYRTGNFFFNYLKHISRFLSIFCCFPRFLSFFNCLNHIFRALPAFLFSETSLLYLQCLKYNVLIYRHLHGILEESKAKMTWYLGINITKKSTWMTKKSTRLDISTECFK